MNLETSYLVHWLTIASPTLPKKNLPWQGRGQGQVTLYNFTPHVISLQWLETSDFVHGLAMWSLGLVMSECSLSGCGQGHVSNFYFVDLENFATASRRYTGDIHNSTIVGLFMTPETVRATRRVMIECTLFITHCLRLNLQLHTIGLVRTCRISSFCTVAW